MTEISGGYAVAGLLREFDVEFVFGQPGGQTLPIYDGLYDLAPRIQHILVHDEKCGVFMADAYATQSFSVTRPVTSPCESFVSAVFASSS